MSEYPIVIGVIAVLTAVIVGLVLVCRRLLKLRERLAPETVYPAEPEFEYRELTPPRRDREAA